jgi:transposase
MNRLMLTDEFWSKLSPILQNIGIYDKRSLRLTIEAILYRLRVGCPLRDIPKEFGNWNKIYKRFNHWSRCDKFMFIFKTLAKDPDMEWKLIDGSIVKAHHLCSVFDNWR